MASPATDPLRVLILGGTTEASALARCLAPDPSFQPTLSLAGRTSRPAPQPIPVRIGGFGGPDGLAAYLRAHAIDAVIDATHPFAAQITRNAIAATAATATPLLAIRRPPWHPQPGDRWHQVADMTEAAAALGPTPRRVMLTIGQQELAPFVARPQHRYLVRSIDPPATVPPAATVIAATGPFDEPGERALLQAHRIDILVTKNSGGAATRPKLDAARALGLDVVIVARPPCPAGLAAMPDAAAALRWLAAHAARRGE